LFYVETGETLMTDEIGADTRASDQSRIRRASEAIRDMADDLKPAAKGLEPIMQRFANDLYNMTRQAPFESLAIAFLLGVLIARRR
jgi:hypothetical protein